MKNKSKYPENWDEIATRIKEAAGWRCERCKARHHVESRYVLTVHHLDGDPSNSEPWNLAALCQRCHLKIQGRVKMGQMFFPELMAISEWFKPHLEGYLVHQGCQEAVNNLLKRRRSDGFTQPAGTRNPK